MLAAEPPAKTSPPGSVAPASTPEARAGVLPAGPAAGADAIARVGGDLALMRLAACESFERAARDMLVSFAQELLGRELALAPVDVAALLRRAVASFAELEPVHVVVSPEDESRAAAIPLPLRTDPELAAGDFIIAVRDGALESPRSFRLKAILEGVLPSATA